MRISVGKRKRWVVATALVIAGLVLVAGVVLGRGLTERVAMAAGGETGATTNEGTIAVTGQATIKAVPDTVSLTLGVQTEAPTAGDAMDLCSAAMAKVMNAIVQMGVPRANIQTANVSLYPQYQYDDKGGNPRIIGYQASNNVLVKWNQMDRVGDLIDAAVRAGANNVWGIGFSLSDSRPLYLQAVAEAVRDAKAKADVLAGAAGVGVGAVKNMRLDSYFSGPIIMNEKSRMDAGMAVPIEPGTVEMQVTVSIEYGIR
jgi:uncharacterized protein YggE